jgi:hypothetical protein
VPADGVEIDAREDGKAHRALRFRLSADARETRDRPPVVVSGFEAASDWFLGD